MRPLADFADSRKIGITDVAAKVNVCPATIRRWAKAEHFPSPIRIGFGKNSRMEWRELDVDQWIAEKEGRA